MTTRALQGSTQTFFKVWVPLRQRVEAPTHAANPASRRGWSQPAHFAFDVGGVRGDQGLRKAQCVAHIGAPSPSAIVDPHNSNRESELRKLGPPSNEEDVGETTPQIDSIRDPCHGWHGNAGSRATRSSRVRTGAPRPESDGHNLRHRSCERCS